jgi:intracellular sulfur oxidation DsrE/DsrF family protein
MKPKVSRLNALLLILVATALSFAVGAASKDQSMADKKVVLQISDADPSKQTLVLNVANNLVKHYGPDSIDIEIVAFGPGLRLMFAENTNKGRIQSLASNGVKFAACANTIKKMTSLRDGEEPKLDPHATRVQAGVVRIIDLVDQGYQLVKP